MKIDIEFPEGISYDVLDDDIYVFELESMTREIVDVWIDACDIIMNECQQAGQPLKMLQDLSHPSVSQTPYSREKGQELTTKYDDLAGKVAFLLPPTTAQQRIRLFIMRDAERNRERRAFTDKDSAIEWLRK